MELSNTKQMKDAYRRYLDSDAITLYEVYSTFSSAKARAYDYCEDLMYEHNGRGLRIVSHNLMMFTVGFTFTDENGDDCFCWITRDYDRYMKITDEDLGEL